MDFRVKKDNQRFGVRAAALIIQNHHIFMIKEPDSYFYTIGGAIEVNETSREAVCREALEEIGVSVEPVRLAFIVENFFTHHHDTYHNIEYHYVCHTSESLPASVDGGREGVWIPLEQLEHYDIRPAFLKTYLPKLNQTEQIIQIINRGK